MTPKVLLVSIAAAIAVAGCAQPPVAPPREAGACNASARVCNVVIAVNNCVPAPMPDPLPIAAAISPVVINWRIDPQSAQAGFTFVPRNGIVVHDDQDQQFSGHTAASPTHFHVTDKNSNHRTYKYAVNVQKDGVACPTLDPSIINGQ